MFTSGLSFVKLVWVHCWACCWSHFSLVAATWCHRWRKIE